MDVLTGIVIIFIIIGLSYVIPLPKKYKDKIDDKSSNKSNKDEGIDWDSYNQQDSGMGSGIL